MKKTNKHMIGIIFVLLGASFWGIGGTASDYLFKHENINVNWFVSARLVVSGLLLLGIQILLSQKRTVFSVWKDRKNMLPLLIFSVFGMLLVQYSFMASVEVGNAAVATLLQYLAPIYILIWLIVRGYQKLQFSDVIIILLTVIGTLLLLTNGSFEALSVPRSAFFWGIITVILLACYDFYTSKMSLRYLYITV